jgi:hypothetical protein
MLSPESSAKGGGMTQHADIPPGPEPHPFHTFGLWAVVAGGLGLIAVFVHMVYPNLQPAPTVGTQVGEIAGDMARSAWQSFRGIDPPAPVEEPVDLWHYLAIVGPTFGVVALILSLVSGLRRENWHYPAYGAGLGIAAITFQFIWLVAMLIMGVMLLVAIVENIGGILGG